MLPPSQFSAASDDKVGYAITPVVSYSASYLQASRAPILSCSVFFSKELFWICRNFNDATKKITAFDRMGND